MREDYEEQEKEINAVIKNYKTRGPNRENGVDIENPFLVAFRKYENITSNQGNFD